MLSSSKEYLHALREGKYLLFLEWPYFITQYYKVKDHAPNTETVRALLLFEWLKCGFTIDDAKRVAVLYALLTSENNCFRGELACSLTTIVSVAFECSVYFKNEMQGKVDDKNKLNTVQILALMAEVQCSIPERVFGKDLEASEADFLSWAAAANINDVETARHAINSIISIRYLVEDYCTLLSTPNVPESEFKGIRIDLAQRFLKYLNEQMELNNSVQVEIEAYVNKIRQYQPCPDEESYLNNMVPMTFNENTWRIITNIGLGFFKFWHRPDEVKHPLLIECAKK